MSEKSRQDVLKEGDALYARYAKPLEGEHWGEYIAIARTGELLLGPDLMELSEQALRKLGPGFFVFKIGEMSVGKIR